jgi:hypothetical protein
MTFPPFGGALYLVLEYVRRPFDVVSPTARFRFEHICSFFGSQIRPYTPRGRFVTSVFENAIPSTLQRPGKSALPPHLGVC